MISLSAWYNSMHDQSDTLTSQYISFGLTYRLGRTEMESQKTHGKKPSGRGKKTLMRTNTLIPAVHP